MCIPFGALLRSRKVWAEMMFAFSPTMVFMPVRNLFPFDGFGNFGCSEVWGSVDWWGVLWWGNLLLVWWGLSASLYKSWHFFTFCVHNFQLFLISKNFTFLCFFLDISTFLRFPWSRRVFLSLQILTYPSFLLKLTVLEDFFFSQYTCSGHL